MKKFLLSLVMLVLLIIPFTSFSQKEIINKDYPTIYVEEDTDTYDKATMIKLNLTKVLPEPTDPVIELRAKSIKTIDFYSDTTKLNLDNEIRVGMGRFNEKKFKYIVTYSDNTTKEVSIDSTKLVALLGDEYSNKIIFESGKYKITIAMGYLTLVVKLYMSREDADNPIKVNVTYIHPNPNDLPDETLYPNHNQTIQCVYGDIVPHLDDNIKDSIIVPTKEADSTYSYSFKEWSYDIRDGKRVISNISINPAFNMSFNAQALNILDYDKETARYKDAGEVYAIDNEGKLNVPVYIGRLTGLSLYKSAAGSHTTDNVGDTISYDRKLGQNGKTDEQIKTYILSNLNSTTLSKFFDDSLTSNQSAFKIDSSNIKIDSENVEAIVIENQNIDQYYTSDKSLFADIKSLISETNADQTATIAANHPAGNYCIGLFVDVDIYLNVTIKKTDTTYSVIDYSYEFYSNNHYFALVSETDTATVNTKINIYSANDYKAIKDFIVSVYERAGDI